MRNWAFLFIIFIIGILQVTILDYFKLFTVKPDIFLIIILMAGIYFDLKWALFLSVFAGLFKDIFGITSFGVNIILLPLWTFVVAQLSKRILIDNRFVPAVFIFIIVILNGLIRRAIFFSLGEFISLGIFLRIVFIEALYTALILPWLFKISRPILIKYSTR